MRKGDHPNYIAPLLNPKSHAGTDAQPSSLWTQCKRESNSRQPNERK